MTCSSCVGIMSPEYSRSHCAGRKSQAVYFNQDEMREHEVVVEN